MSSIEKVRVLIVDDEKIIADSLAVILEARGFVVRATYSAEEAIDIASQFAPHALISDVVMPGMSGIDLCTWFSENHPTCKVLLISGNIATAELLAESVQGGHLRTILPKPIRPEEVLRFVATCGRTA